MPLYQHDVTVDPVRFEDGDLIVPTGPGLGVEGDMKKIKDIYAPLSSLNDVKTNFSRG